MRFIKRHSFIFSGVIIFGAIVIVYSSSDDSLTKFLRKLTFPSQHYYFFLFLKIFLLTPL